jgi:hypothetical protein
LFRYYGFEGEAGGEDGPLLLRKGSLSVEVAALEGAPETGEAELASILSRHSKADRRMVISLGTFSPAARKLAEERRVQLWDRTRLEEEVGRMLLAEVDTRPAPAADESLLEPFLRGGMAGLAGRDDPAGTPDGAGLSDGLPPGPDLIDGEGMLQPGIDQERARGLVSERLEGAFRFDLRLVPHYCYAYACPMQRGAGRHELSRGMVLVDAIGGGASAWEPAPLVRWDGTTSRMEPSLDEPAARERARDMIISANTRIVNLKHDRGAVTVYEKVTLKPSAEALRLEHRGLVLWPVWGIEGGNGAVVLDAVSGRVLREELFTPASKAGGMGADERNGRSK